MGNVLIFAEHQDGKLKKTSLELASKAAELAAKSGGQAEAVLIGNGIDALANELAPYGIKKVTILQSPKLDKYNSIGYVNVLAGLVKELNPDILLATASPAGKDFFPRLAARLDTGLAADAVDLKIDGDGKLLATHPIYSGKALVDIKIPNSKPQMALIRPNSFGVGAPQAGATAEVLKKDVDPGDVKAEMKELVKAASDKADLTEAEIIVSGGRAMKEAANFKILQELADVIGATVGASRAAVDSGYAPHDMQVGQTGKVVNPKLYLAFGISGAIQHLAGMRTSKVIVAVNKDPEAPIFQKADYGIVGDLFEIVPLLTSEFKRVLSE
ncbi:electron transfer flavoprotein subunit alpha/FixB family protein [Deltaproteobacteria bacterium PRO3]|nr:electron transfer flavoprotein subunit alpha/FixB family protein [Deltaproteobacteria bacterium PRO3]